MGSLEAWIGGVISAAAGGLSGALGSYVADPSNLDTTAGIHKMLITAAFAAIVPVLAYLKQSPLPGDTTK